MRRIYNQKQPNEERIKRLADYVITHKSTIRQAAAVIGCSKSTAHLDLSVRLEKLDPSKFDKVQIILKKNAAEKHIHGGAVTQSRLKGVPRKSKTE